MSGQDNELRPIDAGSGPWIIGLRTPWTVVLAGGSLIVVLAGILVVSFGGGSDNSIVIGLLTATIGGIAVIMTIAYWQWPAVLRYRVALQAAFPDATVLFASPWGGAREALVGVDGIDAPCPIPRQSRYTSWLVGEADRLSLWGRDGRMLVPYIVMPRTRIVRIRSGVIDKAATPNAVEVIEVRSFDGGVFDLILPAYTRYGGGPTRASIAAQEGARWLSDWWSRAA